MKHESLAALWCELALMDMRLRLLPYRLNRKLLHTDLPGAEISSDTSRNEEILRIARLVETAASHPFIFNMSCLRKALIIRSKLRAAGIPASLIYGVRKNVSDFSAHAWVEAGGLSIFGSPDDCFQRFEEKR